VSNFIKEKNILFCKNNIQEEFNMEKNKQSLQLARTSLTITLFIWFLALTIFFAYTYFLFPMFLIYLIPTILNIIISYEKRYEQNDFFGTIVITLLSYIIFGVIMISIAPHLFYIFAIFFIPQTVFLILSCLTFKKTQQK
jgi:hypothetical protein